MKFLRIKGDAHISKRKRDSGLSRLLWPWLTILEMTKRPMRAALPFDRLYPQNRAVNRLCSNCRSSWPTRFRLIWRKDQNCPNTKNLDLENGTIGRSLKRQWRAIGATKNGVLTGYKSREAAKDRQGTDKWLHQPAVLLRERGGLGEKKPYSLQKVNKMRS